MASERREGFWFWLVCAAYLAAAALVFSSYLYVLNNDGVAYISIASQYARGLLYQPVNAYWAPAYSWLVAAGIRLGFEGLVTAKIINVLSGLGLLLAMHRLRKLLPVNRSIWMLTMSVAAALALYYAMVLVTPDLLLAALIVWYIGALLRYSHHSSLPAAAAIGACIGVAYLIKAVALPVLVAHVVLWEAGKTVLAKHGSPAAALRRLVVMGAVCAVIAGPWVGVISAKMGHFTIGENAGFVHAALNPLMLQEQPMYVRGLLPPPNPDAVSMWDDPTQTPVTDWKPWDSLPRFIDQMKIVYFTAEMFINLVLHPLLLLWALLCAAAVLCIPAGQDARLQSFARAMTLLVALFLGVYLPLVIEERYFWSMSFLSLALAATLLTLLFQHWRAPRPARGMIAALLVCSFLAMPAWRMVFWYDDGRTLKNIALTLDERYELRGKRLADDNWKNGLRVAFYTGAAFFGKPKAGDDAQTEAELLANDIDIYLTTDNRPRFFRSYREHPPENGMPYRVFVR